LTIVSLYFLFFSQVDINFYFLDGYSTLHYAILGGHSNIVRLLIEVYDVSTESICYIKSPLAVACEEEELKIIKYLCSIGVSSDELLYQYTKKNSINVVYYLAKYSSLTDKYKKQTNPLHVAVAHNYSKITQILLKYQPCFIEKTNANGKTPRACIDSSSNYKIVKLFNEIPQTKSKIN